MSPRVHVSNFLQLDENFADKRAKLAPLAEEIGLVGGEFVDQIRELVVME